MSQTDSAEAYFSEPDEVLRWKPIHEESSDGALVYRKKNGSAKRKRNSDPKNYPKTENISGRRRKNGDNGVDDMEQCAKRMKCMSLQNVPSPKKDANPFEIDAGYEGDCDA